MTLHHYTISAGMPARYFFLLLFPVVVIVVVAVVMVVYLTGGVGLCASVKGMHGWFVSQRILHPMFHFTPARRAVPPSVRTCTCHRAQHLSPGSSR